MTIEWKTSKKPCNYEDTINLMEQRIEDIHLKKSPELVWLLEHPSIYTSGTGSSSNELLDSRDIPVYETGRGGKFTYHGPGQRIIYLMLNLKERGGDLRKYIASLEGWTISCLTEIGIKCFKREGRIGIWTISKSGKEVKIAAIGIRIRKWITYHGIAINVNPNLDHYNGIIACGIKEYGVTSLHQLGYDIDYTRLDSILKDKFNDFF